MLMSALSANPIHCLWCNLEVKPEAIPLPPEMVQAVAHWCWIAGALERLELDSGPYERWAQGELLDLSSPVNREGLELREELNRVRRCYYVLFQALADELADGYVVPDSCPLCGAPFTESGSEWFTRLVCENCSLALVNV
jgi:predicted  nucleic acid-binding Zn ribbon protein